MTTITDYKKKLTEKRDETVNLLEKSGFQEKANTVRVETDQIFEKENPSILFYGLYNSGKSTLINAIFQDDIADVGDIPTTCQTQVIPWGNFTIIDTPGINAKNEHTLIAEREVRRHDLVIFVIDDMNVEEKTFYSAFVSVLKNGSDTLIVINEKNADGTELETSPKIQKLKTRIIENIRMECKKQNAESIEKTKNFHHIFSVNALSGFDSCHYEGIAAKTLYDSSGIDNLTLHMNNLMCSSEGVKMLLPAIRLMKETLTETLEQIKEHFTDVHTKKYGELRNRILRQQDGLYQTLLWEGKNKIQTYGAALYDAIISNQNTIQGEDIVSDLKALIQEKFESASVGIKDQIIELYPMNLEDLEQRFKQNNLKMLSPDQQSIYETDISSNFDPLLENGLTMLGGLLLSEPANLAKYSALIPDMIFPSIPLPDIPGTIFIIVKSIHDLFRRKKAKEEERQRILREQMQQVNQANDQIEQQMNQLVTQIVDINHKIQTEMVKLENSYQSCIDELIKQTFGSILDTMEQEYLKEQKERTDLEQHAEEMNTVLSDLIHIESEIGR